MELRRDNCGDLKEPQQENTPFSSQKRSIDAAFLNKTISLFQSRYGKPLSQENAREIVENMTGFFKILAEWEKTEHSQHIVANGSIEQMD